MLIENETADLPVSEKSVARWVFGLEDRCTIRRQCQPVAQQTHGQCGHETHHVVNHKLNHSLQKTIKGYFLVNRTQPECFRRLQGIWVSRFCSARIYLDRRYNSCWYLPSPVSWDASCFFRALSSWYCCREDCSSWKPSWAEASRDWAKSRGECWVSVAATRRYRAAAGDTASAGTSGAAGTRFVSLGNVLGPDKKEEKNDRISTVRWIGSSVGLCTKYTAKKISVHNTNVHEKSFDLRMIFAANLSNQVNNTDAIFSVKGEGARHGVERRAETHWRQQLLLLALLDHTVFHTHLWIVRLNCQPATHQMCQWSFLHATNYSDSDPFNRSHRSIVEARDSQLRKNVHLPTICLEKNITVVYCRWTAEATHHFTVLLQNTKHFLCCWKISHNASL